MDKVMKNANKILRLVFVALVFMVSFGLQGQQIEKESIVFRLYPNPATSYVSIEYKGTQDFTISIVNIIGVEVYKSNILHSYEAQQYIGLTHLNLENGIYLVKIIQDDKAILTQKLVYRHL